MATLGTATHKVVLFGGVTETGFGESETWIFDGVTWTLVDTTGPTGRNSASMATLP